MIGILATGAGGTLPMMLIWAVAIGAMFLLLIRPQKKEQKRMQALIATVEVGDTVLTTSGFYGTVIHVTDEDIIVEFGNNKNCRIPMKKGAIADIEKPETSSAS